jgi:hypothetical protein
MNKYNLDWNLFNAGFQKELQKHAGVVSSAAKGAGSTVVSAGKEALKQAPGAIVTELAMEGAGRLLGSGTPDAGAGGGFNLGQLATGFNNNVGNNPQAVQPTKIQVTLPTPRPNILNDTGTPQGLSSIPENKPLSTLLEKGSSVTDLVLKSLQHRATNSAINQIMSPDVAPSPTQEELEIVTKHPEMKEVFKDPKNREYLEKLISK